MLRTKKTLFVGSVLFSLEFLSLAVLISRPSAGSHRIILPLPAMAVASDETPPVGLNAPAKLDGGIVLAMDGETTPDLGLPWARTERAHMFFRTRLAVPACCKRILTPKVSRCISKSVFNL